MTGFEPHELDWSQAASKRFWDWHSVASADIYFSGLVGGPLLDYIAASPLRLEGRILDFGCGQGHLLEKLCRRGLAPDGIEFSEVSVNAARARLAASQCGARVELVETLPSPQPTGTFDLVFLIETIEHLLEGERGAVLREVNRLTCVGGGVVVTTPNEEPLESRKTICAQCGAIFHPMQHVSSWSAGSLASYMSSFGFATVSAKSFYLMDTYRKSMAVTLAARVLRRKRPHLVYLGRKESDVTP